MPVETPPQNKSLHTPASFGDLPKSWTWSRLDDACIGIFDCPHSTPVLTEDGPLVVRTQDIISGVFRVESAAHVSEETYQDRVSRVVPTRGDLLYSREGTYFGIAAEVPEGARVCLGQRMVLIRPKPEITDFRFLRHWLNSPTMASHIHGYRDGTVAERLNLPTIRALPTLLPPLSHQRDIGYMLEDFDDKIELNRRMNETLESIARALFRSWFIDFDPVRVKAAGRKPPGLDPAVAKLFPNRLVDSDLGEIPEGWKTARLPEVIEVNPTRSLSKGADAPYLDMQGMPTQGHRPSEWIIRSHGSGMKFINGDTLLARITPCLENGKTAFVDFLSKNEVGWGSTEYIVLRPKTPLPPCFGYYLARSDRLRDHAIQNMTGTSGRQRVPAACFDSFMLVVPPEGIARAFGEQVDVLMSRISRNTEQSRTLAATRNALLPKLLSGELRVGA